MEKRRIYLFFILSILMFNLVFLNTLVNVRAEDDMPSDPTQDENYEKIKNATDKIPLDEQGGIDEEKLEFEKSKAEERIDEINKWVKWTDPVFMFVFNIPLRLSWEFGYLFFLVLLSISIFHNIPIWVGMDKEWFNILLGFGVTFALGFFRIFDKIVNWIILITNKWWWNLAIIGAIIILIAIAGFGHKIGKKIKEKREKSQEELDRQRLHQGAETAEGISNALMKGFSKG